jgi:hypothetical protein
MPRETEYFDSQASASASLGLDIYKIREAKTEGCSAFRSGRVYRTPLLEWMEAKRAKARQAAAKTAAGNADPAKARTAAIAEAAIAITSAYEAEALTNEQFFEVTTALVEASGNKEMLKKWIELNFIFLAENFSGPREVVDAFEAHPKIVRWLFAQSGKSVAGISGNKLKWRAG